MSSAPPSPLSPPPPPPPLSPPSPPSSPPSPPSSRPSPSTDGVPRIARGAAFEILRDQTVVLPRGTRWTFTGHSHKEVEPGYGESPLVVEGRLDRPGRPPETTYASVFHGMDQHFRVGDDRVELLEHVYGKSMKLRAE